MSKKLSIISLVLLIALTMSLIPSTHINAAWIDHLKDGGDRLVASQNADGGWDWPGPDGNPSNSSPANTIGPIGMGLAETYLKTNDASELAALQKVGAFLLTKTNNFSPSDGYLAAKLDQVFGGSTYRNHVMANFYTPLANGTYNRNGAGTLYSTASYINMIRTARSGLYANLAAWDIGMGLVGAASAGAGTSDWVTGVKAEINELDASGSQYYDVLGLAGAIYGLSFVGEDFDPTSGSHAAASNIVELANILVSYQLSSGGYTWTATATNPGDESVQETAYAILALNQISPIAYQVQISKAAAYIRNVQLATGGWGTSENNEVTGEALWALTKENVNPPNLVLGSNTQPANSSTVKSGIHQIKVEFDQDVLHDNTSQAANNVNNYLLVEAGLNGTFDTTSCAVPGGPSAASDDIQITIDSVLYDGSDPFISSLTINGGVDLPDGKYRLFVCGTTSIENLYGIELNDGASDEIIDFSVVLSTSSTSSTTAVSDFSLPSTGFAIGQLSNLPSQPMDKLYSPSALVLQIPDLDIQMNIVGIPQVDNNWDTTWLGQNAGWLQGSAYPTWTGNTVLTGHVWNNTNTPGAFANIKNLQYGQLVQIINNGETYTYQVVSNELIKNYQVNLVFSHEDFDTITLLTCENYSEQTQTYHNRRMVKAILISVE